MKAWAIVRDGVIVNLATASKDVPNLYPNETCFPLEDTDTRTIGSIVDDKDLLFEKQDVILHRIIFQLVNDVRVLKGQGTITATQYKNYVRGLMA